MTTTSAFSTRVWEAAESNQGGATARTKTWDLRSAKARYSSTKVSAVGLSTTRTPRRMGEVESEDVSGTGEQAEPGPLEATYTGAAPTHPSFLYQGSTSFWDIARVGPMGLETPPRVVVGAGRGGCQI